METRKTILFIVGIFLLLIGVIIFGFFPAVSQLMHDDEVEYFTATLVDVNQESVTHVRRRHSYTSYINTLTFKSNDEKHPANFTVVEDDDTGLIVVESNYYVDFFKPAHNVACLHFVFLNLCPK